MYREAIGSYNTYKHFWRGWSLTPHLIPFMCSLRWTPLIIILFPYPVLLLQCHLWTHPSGGASGITPLLSGKTWGGTSLTFLGMLIASMPETIFWCTSYKGGAFFSGMEAYIPLTFILKPWFISAFYYGVQDREAAYRQYSSYLFEIHVLYVSAWNHVKCFHHSKKLIHQRNLKILPDLILVVVSDTMPKTISQGFFFFFLLLSCFFQKVSQITFLFFKAKLLWCLLKIQHWMILGLILLHFHLLIRSCLLLKVIVMTFCMFCDFDPWKSYGSNGVLLSVVSNYAFLLTLCLVRFFHLFLSTSIFLSWKFVYSFNLFPRSSCSNMQSSNL